MRQELSDSERQINIRILLDKSATVLGDCDDFIEKPSYISAINRLYYACFYLAQALLLKNNIVAYTHQGVRKMLGEHFVRKGLIQVQTAKVYGDILTLRMNADYDFTYQINAEKVLNLRAKANDFIDETRRLIDQQ